MTVTHHPHDITELQRGQTMVLAVPEQGGTAYQVWRGIRPTPPMQRLMGVYDDLDDALHIASDARPKTRPITKEA